MATAPRAPSPLGSPHDVHERAEAIGNPSSPMSSLVGRLPKGPEIVDAFSKARARRRTQRDVAVLLEHSRPIWLEIGSGPVAGSPPWVTLDYAAGCDLRWDVTRGLPFPDGAVQRIYSSHLFEHLDATQGSALMRECLRVLVPGGEFSICVPNARLYLDAYASRTSMPEAFLSWTPAITGSSSIDVVNYIAYMAGEHRLLFDEESLVARVGQAGFVNVALREFDPAIDLPERRHESVYALGFKPGDQIRAST